MPKDQEPQNTQSNQSDRLSRAGIMAAGLLAIVAVAYCSRPESRTPTVPDSDKNSTPAPMDIDKLVGDKTPQEIFDLTENLREKYYEINLSESDKEDSARSLTLVKAGLIVAKNKQFQTHYILPIIEGGKMQVAIGNRRFDLEKTTDFTVGAALVDYLFEKEFDEELNTTAQYNYINRQKVRDVNNLFWLTDNFEIELDNVPPIQKTQDLDELARTLHAWQQTGIITPKRILLVPKDYDPQKTDPDTMTINASAGSFNVEDWTLNYLSNQYPDFLPGYTTVLTEAYSKRKGNYKNPEFLSTDGYTYSLSDTNRLASELNNFIMDGVAFRARIAYAKVKGYTEADELQAIYDYLRSFMGNDFTKDGKPKNLQTFLAGEIVEIEDYEIPTTRQGIYLRHSPVLEIDDVEGPTVGSTSKVRIVEGPVIAVSEGREEAAPMFKVQAGRIIGNRIFEPYLDENGQPRHEGWIRQDWFGRKIALEELEN